MEFSDGDDYPGSPYRQLIRMREVMDDNGDADKLIWTTEYGVPTSVVSYDEQADFIRDFLETWSSLDGVGPMFIYTTRDRETGTTDDQDNFGIFETDWTRKEAADVIEDWIEEHPGTATPTDPTFIECIEEAIAAVGQVIHSVIHAGIEVSKFLLNAVVSVVDWAISAVVSGIKFVATAIVDGVKWVVDTVHDVMDALCGTEEAPQPAAVTPLVAAQKSVPASDVPVAALTPADAAAPAAVQTSQDAPAPVADDAAPSTLLPEPAIEAAQPAEETPEQTLAPAPEPMPVGDAAAVESPSAAADDAAPTSNADPGTGNAVEKPKARKGGKHGEGPTGKPVDKPGDRKATHPGRLRAHVATTARPATDGAPDAGTTASDTESSE